MKPTKLHPKRRVALPATAEERVARWAAVQAIARARTQASRRLAPDHVDPSEWRSRAQAARAMAARARERGKRIEG